MKFFLGILGLVLVTSVSAQKSDTLQVFQFSDTQEASWDSIQQIWNKTYFQPFLKKNKIHITCAHCSGVSAIMVLEVFNDGHCHTKLLRGKKCGAQYSKKEIDELERSFMKIEFPPSFYNKTLKLYLGKVLSC